MYILSSQRYTIMSILKNNYHAHSEILHHVHFEILYSVHSEILHSVHSEILHSVDSETLYPVYSEVIHSKQLRAITFHRRQSKNPEIDMFGYTPRHKTLSKAMLCLELSCLSFTGC